MMAPEPQTTTAQKTSHSVGVNVTTKTESTPVINSLELNYLYFIRTIRGILCLVQLVLGIICMGCGSPAVINYAHFFMFVVVVFFIVTAILSIIHLFTIQSLFSKVPWLVVELLASAAATVLYFIAMVVMLTMSSKANVALALKFHNFYSAYIAAGVFALFNTIAYGASLYFNYVEWRASRPTVTSPAANGNAS